MNAEDYFQSRNGGKPSNDMAADDEFIYPPWAVQLMEDYAKNQMIAYDKWLSKFKWGTDEILSPERGVEEYIKDRDK